MLLRAPWEPRHPAHPLTTAEIPAAYPFMSAGGTGLAGVHIGSNLLGGGDHAWEPWLAYEHKLTSDSNTTLIGEVGAAKSSLAKSLVIRTRPYGRKAVIVDPKGEWTPVAHMMGCEPIKVDPNNKECFNPLQDLSQAAGARLIKALGKTALERQLAPVERTGLAAALWEVKQRGEPLIPAVAAQLLNPTPRVAERLSMGQAELRGALRDLGLALEELCEDLEGMFDGPTSPGVGIGGACSVLDLSNVQESRSMPVLMTCAMTWMRAQLAAHRITHSDSRTWFIIDEAWRIFEDLACAEEMQSAWKDVRNRGWANLLITHRLSDFGAAGADGSREKKLAEGLLKDSGTVIVYRQKASELPALRDVLGLNTLQAEWVSRLPQGVALHRIGKLDCLVRHERYPFEIPVSDTDNVMLGAA